MKAIVHQKYGSPDVLELVDVETPIPNDDEVLVRVHAVSLNKADLYRLGPPFLLRLFLGGGVLKPKNRTVGSDMAGRVEAVGRNVKRFRPGDEIFGCARGSLAEYLCAREDLLVLKPNDATFEESAAVPVAAITALQGLRKGQIQPGHNVLIDGASGGVGTFAVQIAKSFGAEVTAVCSTKNLENARSMGADHVIDYTKEDFTKKGQSYDLIVEVNGYRSILAYRRALKPNGTYVLIGSSRPLAQLFQVALLGRLISATGSGKMGFMGIAKVNQADLVLLRELLESAKVKPVIDRRYPLSETADAFRYLEEGHARGKVIITVEHNT